jgi:CheY-like chemotaxis protein
VSQRVLIVDDVPETAADALAIALEHEGLEANSVKPEEVSRLMLDEADLILVDFRLGDWVEPRDRESHRLPPERQLIADRPIDGLALAAILRSQLPAGDIRGVALLSANLIDLVQDFTPSVTEHAAARINGLDWAFGKGHLPGLPGLSTRVADFTGAVCQIRATWRELEEKEGGDREIILQRLLDLPQTPWTQVAARDVHAAQPPINQLATATHGLSILRWLGQRILPYPTFLLDQARLAMALGVEPDSLSDHAGTDRLNKVLGSVRYTGPLAEFLGPRWWRAGVRSLVREWTGSSSPGPEAANRLAKELEVSLTPLEPPGAVLCIGPELQPWSMPVPREHAVRVRPDDWPPYAETGWMPEELVREHAELYDLVDPADRERLEAAE